MAIEFRQIRAEDIESFREAVDIVARERKYLYLTEAPDADRLAALVEANMSRGSPHLLLVDRGVVAGWCNIFPSPHAVQAHVGHVVIGLRPEWRDRGWGTKLMSAALAAADGYGYTRVELSVYASNPRAQTVYRKLGFVEEGVKRRSVLIDGQYFDEIIMARLRIP